MKSEGLTCLGKKHSQRFVRNCVREALTLKLFIANFVNSMLNRVLRNQKLNWKPNSMRWLNNSRR